jgi:two-component system, NtrC family, response regulator GlrR
LVASPKFRALLDEINMVAPVDSAVLVRGETGTGKEVVAQAIHDASPRRQQPVRCHQLRRDSRRIAGERTLRP